MRARSIRAFGRWATAEGTEGYEWWQRVPLPNVDEAPQPTASEADYRQALARARSPRDRALLAVLWSSGLRRVEAARMRIEDLNLDDGYVAVITSKAKYPRVAPQSPEAVKHLARYLRTRHDDSGPLWLVSAAPSAPMASACPVPDKTPPPSIRADVVADVAISLEQPRP
jgi:integrase/recombinase XerD